MVTVDKSEGKERICNSCVCRDCETHKISIGDGNINTTVHLCKKCLYLLYKKIGEIDAPVNELL